MDFFHLVPFTHVPFSVLIVELLMEVFSIALVQDGFSGSHYDRLGISIILRR